MKMRSVPVQLSVLIVLASGFAGLSGCGPSKEQKEREKRFQTWRAELEGQKKICDTFTHDLEKRAQGAALLGRGTDNERPANRELLNWMVGQVDVYPGQGAALRALTVDYLKIPAGDNFKWDFSAVAEAPRCPILTFYSLTKWVVNGAKTLPLSPKERLEVGKKIFTRVQNELNVAEVPLLVETLVDVGVLTAVTQAKLVPISDAEQAKLKSLETAGREARERAQKFLVDISIDERSKPIAQQSNDVRRKTGESWRADLEAGRDRRGPILDWIAAQK